MKSKSLKQVKKQGPSSNGQGSSVERGVLGEVYPLLLCVLSSVYVVWAQGHEHSQNRLSQGLYWY